MPQTVEVRFKGTRREFFAWPDDREPLRLHEAVVVPAERGQDLGRVLTTGPSAEKKCGACSSCAVGAGVAEARSGGRAVETSAEPGGADEGSAVAVAGDAPAEEETPAAPPPAPEPPAPPADGKRGPKLRQVLRRATQEDIRQANELRKQEDDLRQQAIAKVRQHKLEMRVSDTEWQFDRSKLTIYFTAEKRVDFRVLVRELAAAFKARIELRQIGVRDEAARLGGVGRCGREFCCSTWLKDLNPVSLALAKDQHLSLNPAQISGGCGRLLCCLKYEHEFYVAARKRFPREGKTLQTRHGAEKVVAVDIFRERVFLRSEGHGPRIIPLVQLREEQAEREAGAEPLAAPAVPARPGMDRRPPDGKRPEARPAAAPASQGGKHERPPQPSRPPQGAAGKPALSEQRPAQGEAPRQKGRPGERAERPRGRAPEQPLPPPRPTPEPTGQPDNAEADGQQARRRRRRGRRGRGGRGGETPGGNSSPSPEA
ncbi:MAG: hypothetical protein IPK12_16130 [Gemmatimonadetes bacterium]|nr:hypothetical protein [Gemmatimonadota bacterium]